MPRYPPSQIPSPARTRKQSQAATRERLLAVARKHFLRFGLIGSATEKIAKDAGYTRGALYANFANKDELFVEVMRKARETVSANFWSILKETGTAQERFERMREAFGDLLTDREWVVLQTEFQSNALRSPAIRIAYEQQVLDRSDDSAALLREAQEQGLLRLSASPTDVVAVLSSVGEGLAMRQLIARHTDTNAARRLALLCFDRMIFFEHDATSRTAFA